MSNPHRTPVGHPEAVAESVQDALDAGVAPDEILKEALLGGMDNELRV
ncbi:MAG: hypothetical protein V3R65_02185 [Acidiferrobacterales bacterium]